MKKRRKYKMLQASTSGSSHFIPPRIAKTHITYIVYAYVHDGQVTRCKHMNRMTWEEVRNNAPAGTTKRVRAVVRMRGKDQCCVVDLNHVLTVFGAFNVLHRRCRSVDAAIMLAVLEGA